MIRRYPWLFLTACLERFNSLISALDALGNEDEAFSLDFFKSRLLQEEQRIEMRTWTSSTRSKLLHYFLHEVKQGPHTTTAEIAEKQDIRLSVAGRSSRACSRELEKAK